jgi:hypothetical protein
VAAVARAGVRRLVPALAAAAAVHAAPPAPAHQGSPNFLSTITSVTPAVEGVTVTVLNRDDRLLLRNASGRDVLVKGYSREPYARIDADGGVWVNIDSEAFHINAERDGKVPVPDGVDSKGEPRWERLDNSGRFEWHDHRMHWMAESDPPMVKDKGVRTKVYDWVVPLEVGGRRGAIAGTLFWTPTPSSSLPVGAVFAFAGLVIALCVGVIAVRRRRGAPAEAW